MHKQALTFRHPTPSDADVLTNIATKSKAHWGYSDAFMLACADELRVTPAKLQDDNFQFCLAAIEQQVIGFYCLEKLHKREVELEALFVQPEWMGKGVGKQLMLQAIDAAKSLGADSMVIHSDPNAAAFYQSFGAKLVSETASQSIPGRLLPTFNLLLT